MQTKPGGSTKTIPDSYSILIIDDHELFSTALMITLRLWGRRAYTAKIGGLDAILEQATGQPPGLVLLDPHLGLDADGRELNGVNLVPGLRARGWAVLVLSDSHDESRIAAAIAPARLAGRRCPSRWKPCSTPSAPPPPATL
jgi:DNA-binding NarL/FixJ family response regulator